MTVLHVRKPRICHLQALDAVTQLDLRVLIKSPTEIYPVQKLDKISGPMSARCLSSTRLRFGNLIRIRSRPGKPNQRKGQNEKLMNFAHFCEFWCFSLGKQARFTLNFCSGMRPGKFMNWPFFWFGLPGPLLKEEHNRSQYQRWIKIGLPVSGPDDHPHPIDYRTEHFSEIFLCDYLATILCSKTCDLHLAVCKRSGSLPRLRYLGTLTWGLIWDIGLPLKSEIDGCSCRGPSLTKNGKTAIRGCVNREVQTVN